MKIRRTKVNPCWAQKLKKKKFFIFFVSFFHFLFYVNAFVLLLFFEKVTILEPHSFFLLKVPS